jgi:hypothetical protein
MWGAESVVRTSWTFVLKIYLATTLDNDSSFAVYRLQQVSYEILL